VKTRQKEQKVKSSTNAREPSTSEESSEEKKDIKIKRTSHRKKTRKKE